MVYLIGHPIRIALIAVVFFAAFAVRQALAGPSRSRALLVAGGLWLLAAAWELAILIFTPEANIRVDMFVWVPVLGIVSAWALLGGWR